MPGNVTSPGTAVQPSSAPALASNALPVGTQISEFEVTRVIGEGGFSVVYLAFDHTLHRSIALKEYIPGALASRRGDQTVAVRSAQHQQTFEAGLRSFINEARLLAQFDHPALVKVYRFWEANGTAYMAMPYYEGRTLKDVLRDHPEQANEAWLKRLLMPLLDALALLHDHHCYHRDIAPDNIQILDNEHPVLLDFGAARRTIGDMTQAFTVILKPGYAPIEQYADETDLKQGPWTDLYALSAVLYWAIVGKPPPTAVARVIKDPLKPLSARHLGGFDPAFLSGIDSGLAVRPEARPQSVSAWRKMLRVDERVVSQASHARLSGEAAQSSAESQPETASPKPRHFSAAETPGADASETDRTVLVPGLRRPLPRPTLAAPTTTRSTRESSPTATATSGPPANAEAPEQAAQLSAAKPTRRWALRIGALVGVLAAIVVGWFVVARFFDEHGAANTIAKLPDHATTKPSSSAMPLPPQSAPATPSSPIPSQDPEQAQAPAQTHPSGPTELRTPLPAPAVSEATETNAVAHPAPDTRQATPGERKGRAEANVKTPDVTPASPPRASPEDERQWAAIRNTDNVDDLRAFRRRFPQSTHAQDAAVRIQQLIRQSRENSRSTEPAAPSTASTAAKSAPAAQPKSEVPAPGMGPATAANATTASSASGKGTLRIRVQPFGYVYVDGALVGPSPPSREMQLSPGKHRIEARNEQENPPVVVKEVDIAAGGSTEVPLRFGQ